MPSIRSYVFSALAAAVSLAAADGTCDAFGIDFLDEQSYFINTLSNDDFTFVSQFTGTCGGTAQNMLVPPEDAPNSDELICSDVDTTPGSKMSTCPIEKSQMTSGLWLILVMGDNPGGDPFAYERDVTLDCGPQVTTTVTPTVTYNVTVTPTSTATVFQTVTNTTTFGPTATVTLPSSTACPKTVTPKPVIITDVKTYTKTIKTWKRTQTIKTTTVTATCSVPPKPQWPDKRCTYTPTKLHPKALATGAPKGKATRWHWRGAARAVDPAEARRRFAAAAAKREMKERAAAQIEERAPDAPTITVTFSVAVNATSTVTAAPTTLTETDLVTTTVSTTLPPKTVYSGAYTSTKTLPTQTKTKHSIKYTTVYTTKTIHATWTLTKTVTPTASISSCKKAGGHWGKGRW